MMKKVEQERQIWLRLAKLKEGGASLGTKAAETLAILSSEHPEWKISQDGHEEFPVWMNIGDGADDQTESPKELEALMQWLKDNPKSSPIKDDDWRDRCRNEVGLATAALKALDRDGEWIPHRVQDALNVWATDEDLLSSSWKELRDYLDSLSDERVFDILRSLSFWLQALAAVLKEQDAVFFKLIEKVLDQPPVESGIEDDPLTEAINHPVGHVAGALLRWWDRYRREGNRGIQGEVRDLMSRICDANEEKLRYGRVVLARSIVALFAEDREWAVENMIPLFYWEGSETEAAGAWSGFLNSPRGNPDLFTHLKKAFLEIREHFPAFDEEYRDQFIRFLTIIGLSRAETISHEEMRDIFNELDLQQLQIAAQTMSNAMEGAADKAANYWNEVWYPFFQTVWPKKKEAISQETAGRFAEVCVDAGEEFPNAVVALKNYLVPIQWPDWVLDKLVESGRHKDDPEEALELVSRIMGNSHQMPVLSLKQFLDNIGAAKPSLRDSSEFKRLERSFAK
jgi:hypothetical protein